ncbi:(S)-ureidoglycine aminohydrolase [Candidimonas nitroreducens]|uniref:(S)-ureidoglycine aminohydrolase n=1 Tax=Candidimonas nitroreducens TaxID=683354 RepID=A0A225M303_9BURK|nr:(S)-ureidoglycine aminohydrolase [Candidimonas nitroreducens]OWT55707.1 (S)-ureidoglycine aminohydrolase [Candidimonas nitroreducens]
MSKRQIQPPGVFAHHRAALTSHYAVMPPEGILESRIPGISNTTISVQASRSLGAEFAQILLDMRAGGGMDHARNDGLQAFFYVISGQAWLEIDGRSHDLRPGSFAYVPAGANIRLANAGGENARVIWLKKAYEAVEGIRPPKALVSHRDQVEKVNKHTQGRTWQHLLPDEDPAFDFAMNILSFEPGNYFPMIETHVMEHGLYMLEGQGMYLLQADWHECWEGDFIYMAPFCPQFFYATGWSRASYLLYKNVNRDIV